MGLETVKKIAPIAPIAADPLGDILVGYHFISGLLGLYSSLMRDGALLADGHRAQLNDHLEQILEDVGSTYGLWELQRKEAPPVGADLEASQKRTVTLYKFSRHELLDRILHSLNAWTSARHWLNLTQLFDQRWIRVVRKLQITYPNQKARLDLLEKKAVQRSVHVGEILLAVKATALTVNHSFAIPKDMTVD